MGDPGDASAPLPGAETAAMEAERLRHAAEEHRDAREHEREAGEKRREEQEERREADEQVRVAAVDAVRATARELTITMERMEVVEEMRRELRHVDDATKLSSN
jgi:hypothetical protein